MQGGNLAQADTLIFGRVTYEVMEAASRLVDLKLESRLEFGSGVVALRYEPRR